MKQCNWKADNEMLEVINFIADNEKEPGETANRSNVIRRLVSNSTEYIEAAKRMEKLKLVAA